MIRRLANKRLRKLSARFRRPAKAWKPRHRTKFRTAFGGGESTKGRRLTRRADVALPVAWAAGMALDPAALKARIDLRVAELKVLAAWTAANWRAEPERLLRGSPPPPARRDEDE